MLFPSINSKSYWQQFLILLILIAGGFLIFSSLALFLGKLFFGTDTESRWYLYTIQSLITLGAFFLPALLFSFCASKCWFSYNKADTIAPPPLVGYVLILSLFILPIIACLGYFNEQISFPQSMQKIEMWMREMEENNKQILNTLTVDSSMIILWTNMIVMALLPALFEEFLFRGTIQQFLSKWFANKHIAIIVTAITFSAIHFQFYGFIPRFLLGVYLGYLFVWGKSLWLPIFAHFMHNAVSLIFDYGAQRRGIDLESIEPSQIQEFYPVVIFCAICVGVGIYLMYRGKVTTERGILN